MKRFLGILMASVIIFCCAAFPANAAELSGDYLPPVIARVSGRVNSDIPAKTIAYLGDEISLDRGEIVSFNCTYTPKSASVDFGIVDSSGVFHYLNCTSGSFNKSIKIEDVGQYTLAIRNNASYTVTVSGTLKY